MCFSSASQAFAVHGWPTALSPIKANRSNVRQGGTLCQGWRSCRPTVNEDLLAVHADFTISRSLSFEKPYYIVLNFRIESTNSVHFILGVAKVNKLLAHDLRHVNSFGRFSSFKADRSIQILFYLADRNDLQKRNPHTVSEKPSPPGPKLW